MTKGVPRVLAILLACLGVLVVATAARPEAVAAATFPYLRSPTVSVAAGGSHTVVLRANGRLQAWGSNTSGQLGDGTTTRRLTPTWVGSDFDWVAVACGSNHTLALKADGSLYAWGQNLDGQLGLGGTTSRSSPTRVGTGQDWVAVACGAFHSVGLKANGTLWVWGDNTNGQLGLNDTNDRASPVQLSGTNWSFIAAGGWHTLAVKTTGQLYAWGRNDYGQLGDGAGVEWHYPIRMTDATNWVAVAGGAYHSAGLRADGSLYTWGRNDYGQLGLGSTTNVSVPTRVGAENTWVGVGCGNLHTLGLKANGTAWGWGYNASGQVGDGGTTTRTAPVQIGAGTTLASLAAGGIHSAAVRADGSVAAWGHNADGQVGDGSTSNRTSPVGVLAAGLVWPAPRSHRAETDTIVACYDHSLAIKPDGSLWAWGGGVSGQIGDGSTDARPSPVRIGSSVIWRSVAGGASFSVGLRWDGSLYTWGDNQWGQLGLGGTDYTSRHTPQRVGTGNSWTAVAAGDAHVLALRSDGSLWAWGLNYDGQLGIGSTTSTNVPTRVGGGSDWVAVTAGRYSGYALRANGTLYAWGWNTSGELGVGDRANRTSPAQVGTGTTWVAVAAGLHHALGLTVQGTMYAWGANNFGQLGRGDLVDVTAPAQVALFDGWTGVSAGSDQSHGIRADGHAYGWGDDRYGQVGNGATTGSVLTPTQLIAHWTTASGGLRHTLLGDSSSHVFAVGDNTDGRLGTGFTYELVSPNPVMDRTDLAPPSITGLSSSSHPVESAWYSEAIAGVQWSFSDGEGPMGFSTMWNPAAPVIPDLWLDCTGSERSATSPLLTDGIWFFSVKARDVGANWSPTVSRAVRVDTTPPSGVPWASSPSHPDSRAWYPDDTVAFEWGAATDATAGVAGYSWGVGVAHPRVDAEVDGVGLGTTLQLPDGACAFGVRAVDNAGNAGSIMGATVNVDTTPPSGVGTVTSPSHPSSVRWYADDTVEFQWTGATDATSGVAGYSWFSARMGGEPDGTIDGTGTTVTLAPGSGTSDFIVRAVDAAGNVGPVSSCLVRIDTAAPVTTDDADALWHRGPVTVTLRAEDGMTDCSGVEWVNYCVDDGAWRADFATGTQITLRTWKRGGNSGVHTISFFAGDYAGNMEHWQTCEVKLDARPPVTRDDAPLVPTVGPVTVNLTATDAHSGVAETRYTYDGTNWTVGDTIQFSDPGTYWLAYCSKDNVGNTEYVRWRSITVLGSAAPGHRPARALRVR